MTDRELLELAAKAAGIEYEYCRIELGGCLLTDKSKWWNPIADDGDALRLAVKLKIDTLIESALYDGTPVVSTVYPLDGDYESDCEPIGNDPYASTRRAIVRAAAEIGRSM